MNEEESKIDREAARIRAKTLDELKTCIADIEQGRLRVVKLTEEVRAHDGRLFTLICLTAEVRGSP